MKICILNASNPKTIHLESDEYVDLRDRKSCFEGGKVVKQCRSWHSWTYALESEFFVYGKPKWPGIFQYDGIIILVNRDIGELIPLVQKLKAAGKKVAISFHEGVQDLITSSGIPGENLAKRWEDLKTLTEFADFYINIFGQMTEFYEGWLGEKVKFCNLCSLHEDINVPNIEKKYDILVGTRTFNQRLSRNTFLTLGALNGWSKETGRNVHFLSEDNISDGFLKKVGLPNVTLHRGPLEYHDWLKFLAQFKVVCHHDNSSNLGQICYDAVSVDTIPIGSTTWSNIEIGTSDGGDVNTMINLVDLCLFDDDYGCRFQDVAMKKMAQFKKLRRPDAIKRRLLEIFNG